MIYGTIWDAWRLARDRQRLVQELADRCEIGSKEYAQHIKNLKKLERQGYRFVDKIIDLIAEVDHTHRWSIDMEVVPHSDPRIREKHPHFYVNRTFAWCECGKQLGSIKMTELLNKYAQGVNDE